jgi:hypothetical protein
MSDQRQIPTDPMAKAFLGDDPSKVTVMPGQKADAKKQAAIHEKFLFSEACRFGDDMVRYVMAHHKLSEAQRIWGFVLTVFCLRGDYPDGTEDFDELADQGGEDLELAKKNIVEEPERIKDIAARLREFTDAELQEAATFAERTNAYIEATKQRDGISNPQAAYALGRAFHNMRFGFPLEKGGTAAFDEFVRRASAYFERYGKR